MADRVAVCPGTYDPVTYGHLDIIERAAAVFDRVIVAVVRAPRHKQTMFALEERIGFIEQSLADRERVTVEGFSSLVVEFARDRGAGSIVKGLRAVSDFEWEPRARPRGGDALHDELAQVQFPLVTWRT